MTCDRCPLALLCLAGTLRLSSCALCQRVLITLPPRVVKKNYYVGLCPDIVIPELMMPLMVVDYAFAECADLGSWTTVRPRVRGCPGCEPDNSHYQDYRPLGPGYGGG